MTDVKPPTLLPSSGEAQARERAERLVGRVISKRYRVDAVLAMGGMGAVYRGEHVLMHKRIAIKILHPEIEGLPDLVKRFEREAVAGAHIAHPNVAAATDFGELEDGSYFLVLEYVRGPTLFEIVRRGPLPVRRAVHVARQLASALDACHATGIVHRDLKPRNVMVVEDQGDLTKLIDFGLAKVSVDRLSTLSAEDAARKSLEEGRITGMGVIFGTIAYLAPEAAHGMDAVDGRSDLYALGMILYEMLAGKHPFDAVDPIELFKMQRTAPVPPIAERAPAVAVPAAVEAVVTRLVAKDPDARYASGAEVVAALDEALVAAGLDPVAPARLGSLPPARAPAAEEPKAEAKTAALDAGGSSTDAVVNEADGVQRWSPTDERPGRAFRMSP
ncbi:MAG TPA: serine/threonine-protein kinase, partial [Minicystis sp.]|nr:serine/threonine-protein kinase [Minicystis sp.]